MASGSPQPPQPLTSAFRRIWLTQTVSQVGSELSGFGIAVWVYQRTGSTGWLGALTAAYSVGALLVAPWLSRLDRHSRRAALIAADSVAALGSLGVLAMLVGGLDSPWLFVVAAAITGVGNAVSFPALAASVPALVPVGLLGRANALMQIGPALAMIAGPLLAAPAVAMWGLGVVVAVDLATFVVATVTTASTTFGGEPIIDPGVAHSDRSWRAAYTWLRTDGRAVAALLITTMWVNLVMSAFNVTFLAVALEVGGARRAGIPVAVGGAVMLMTSALTARHPPSRVAATFGTGLAVMAAGALVGGLWANFAIVVAGLVLVLAPVPVVQATVAGAFQRLVPPHMYGRVFGLRSTLTIALSPVGALAGGAMGAWLGGPRGAARAQMVTGAVLAGLGLVVLTSRRLRAIDRAQATADWQPSDGPGAPPHSSSVAHT